MADQTSSPGTSQEKTATTANKLTNVSVAQQSSITGLSATEAQAIAKEAYIYGYPMVDGYRIQYAYFVDVGNKEYKAPWNQICNISRVYTPEDKEVTTPNSDTPYSMLGLDLRAEPIVLTVPAIEKDRYYSVQFIDLYTFNFGYAGSRSTGNEAGNFLLAGPKWKGEKPEGIKAVIPCETELALVAYRTQLFGPDDLDNVKKVQAGYKVQPLSGFLGKPTLAAPAIDFFKPIPEDQQRTSPEFFNVLNFILKFCPTHPSETELRARFAKLGIGPDGAFDAAKLSPEISKAIGAGMADAWQAFADLKKKVDAGQVTSGDAFGTREHLKNNYLYRMAAGVMGIYGNSQQEAMYPVLSVDSEGQKLDAAQNRYTVRLAPDQMPPVNAFWSLTMYELPGSRLTANPINRYLINSPMLPSLKRDADGGLTVYIQNDSPGKDKESNWLPAPKGPFITIMRLYWPKDEALNGKWKPPAVARAR
ncbi:MAG TPA: DUF1254 domain-containing protein [Candidatus Acidoferrales bacterium]|nr:DUF1254 domain-containing protein [Candidatus Acidoferrales bacterium]